MELRMDLPRDIVQTAGLAGEDASQKARLLLLLELYREGHISLGRLGELADLSQEKMLERMKEHGTYLNYSMDELAQDRQALQ
jgi:predicted HTH domain antitoxin